MSQKIRLLLSICLLILLSSKATAQFQIESVVAKDVSCKGGNDGQITITVSGGTPPYTYTWLKFGPITFDQIVSNETTVTFPGNIPLTPNLYFIEVVDSDGSVDDSSVTISEPDEALLVSISPDPAQTCTGANLQLTASASGGVPPYSHGWSGPGAVYLNQTNIANPIFNSPVAGDYELTYTITDANDCVISVDITVSNTESPTTDAGADDSTCGNQYTLNASQSFGTGSWSATGPGSASFSSNSDPGATVTVSQPGVYTFTWTETADGCADSDDVEITFFENVNFSTSLTNPSAPANSDGAIQVNVSAGTAPFLYILTDSDNNETTHGPTNDVSYTFTGLEEGTYNIEVTDANSCSLDVNRLLSATITLSVDVQTTATCGGEENGEIAIEILSGVAPFDVMVTTVPGGAAVFAITETNTPGFTISNLAAGTYNVFVEDDAGEIFSSEVNVAEGPFAEISYEGSPFCDEDEAFVTLTGFGGGSFSASPAGLVIDPADGRLDLAASANGTYTVTYSYGDGTCSAEAQTQVVVGELSTVTISYDETPYCQQTGGIATVTIDGQILSSSSNTYTLGNIATDYNFREPEDNSACPGQMTVNVPAGSVITSVDVFYQMTATSGHYMSDQRSQLRVVSPGGLAEEAVYLGSGNTPGTQTYNRTGLTIANGVTGGGPIQFELHAGRIFINDPACNNVWNRVDNNTWTVTVHYTSGHEFVADSEDLDIDPVTGDINLETSLPGTYIVTYNYTEGGCTGSATTTVVILPKPEEPQVEDVTACFDGTEHVLEATAPDGATLVWYESETGFETTTAPSGTEVGEYTAWVAAVLDGCESDRVQATLTIVESPEAPTPLNTTACFDGTEHSADATVADDAELIWYASQFGDELSSAPSATDPGTYTAWAAAANGGCESVRVEVTLVINETPEAPQANNTTECFTGTELSASATPPPGAEIIWYANATGSETASAPSATNPGIYTAWAASLISGTGCESERVEVTLIIHALPEAEITYGGETFCADGIIEVTIITEDNIVGGAFSADPEGGLDIGENTGTINLANSAAGTYLIEYRFYDENFCFNEAYTTITIDEIPGAPIANNVEVCFDGEEHTAGATPPAGATIIWYTTEFGDVTTTAPTATAPGTYTAWAASVGADTDCESERVLVTLIINELPEAPTAQNEEVCFDGNEYSASATPPAGTTLIWYAEATGDDLADAPAASLPGTYTAWAAALDDITLCESERVQVTLVINELPESPTANNVVVCFDGTAHSASATPPAGATIVWYTTEFGDITTTAPTGINPGTYSAWAAAVDNTTGCESERVEVTLLINDSPSAPTANDLEICFDGEEQSASATAPAGASIVWYANQTGDETALAPTGIDPGTYTAWAAAVDDITGCESERVLVTLVIFPLPQAEITYGATNFCAEGIIEITIITDDNIIGGAFSVEPETGLDIGENTGTINLGNSTPGTYEIEYRFYDDNFCFNTAYTTIIIDEIPAIPVAENVEVCFDGEEHIAGATPPAGATIVWYTTEFGDVTTTAPTGTDPGTYTAWAASVGIDTDCESERVLVTLIINELPEPPTAQNEEVCFDGSVHSASATPPAGTSLIWYAEATGDDLADAPTGTMPGIYTAWAAAIDDITLCESERIQVTLIIHELPEAPTANNEEVCFDGTEHSASATPADGTTIVWYAQATGDETAQAPTGTDPGTYTAWAAAVDDITGCESERVEVTLIINDLPEAPVANNFEICFDGEEQSASATAPAGTSLIWYENETGDELASAPTGIAPGTYTAWAAAVDDITGCESERVLVTLVIFPLPEAEITYGATNFCAEGIIEITIITDDNIIGGAFSVEPETGLSIGVNSGTINLGNSTPGTYEIEYRFYDDNFCFNTAYTTIIIDEIPAIPVAENVEVCFDGEEHIAGATPPAGATIVWYTTEFGDATTTAPTGTDPGTYTAWAASVGIDTDCESERVLVTLIINELPEPPTAQNEEVCFDGSVHSASATPPAGTSLIWYAEATGDDLADAPTGTMPGIYTAWAAAIDDITLCESERIQVTLIIHELPEAPTANNEEVCFDGTEHSASATPADGTTIVWYAQATGDETAQAPTGTDPGTYTAWAAAVDDITGCESERVEVTLIINDLPEAPVANNFEICFDGEEQSASATAPAGTSLIWYENETGDELASAPTGIDPGTYTAWAAAVDDITGCESERVLVTLVIFPLPQAEITYGATNFCAEGIIEITIITDDNIIGGAFSVEPETGLSIGVNSGTINLGNSTPGTYEIEYRFYDNNFCFSSTKTTITINEGPALFITDVTDSDCASEALGSITAEVVGGQLPYTFELLDEELNLIGSFVEETNDFFTFTALQTGTYFVRVTDDNECGSSISDAIFIDEPDPITIDENLIVITPISCFGIENGEISLAANGGTGDLYYTLLLDGEQVQGPQTNNGNFSGLGEGVYVVSITDDRSCGPVLSEEFTLVAPDAIAIIAVANPNLVCQEDQAAIDVSASMGNAPYQVSLWLEGTQIGDTQTADEEEVITFNAITQSGTYIINVTDASDCSNTREVIINDPVELLTFNVTGGGDYCAETGGVEVGLDGSEDGINYTLLLDDETTEIIISGTGEAISFGMQTEQGIYTVIASDPVSLCELSMNGNAEVQILPLPQVFNVEGGGDICEDENGIEITLDGSEAGINYQLLLDGLATGDPVAGTGEAISFGSQEEAGTYTVRAVNPATLCEILMEGEAVITSFDRPIVYNLTGGGDICPESEGAAIGLDGSETGISYQLMLDGSETGESLAGTGEALDFGLFTQEGTYTVLAIHPAGCDMMMDGEAVIILLPSPIVFEVQGGGEYCLGGEGVEITLDGSQTGVNYQLFLGEDALDIVEGTGNPISFGLQTQAGTYTVIATDVSTSCTALMDGNAVIAITEPPVASIAYPDSPYCHTGIAEVELTGPAGGTFSAEPAGLVIDADNGEINLENSTPGTYTITYTFSEGGCPGTAVTTVVINENPEITALTASDALCANEASGILTLETSGGELPYTIALMDEDMAIVDTFEQTEAGEFTIENLFAGTYFVVVTDDNNCSSAVSAAVIIEQPDAIVIDTESLTYSESLCEGETDGFISIVATGGTGDDLFYSLILNGDILEENTTGSFTGLAPGTYIVNITDERGCGPVESAPIVITENPLPLADAGEDRTICFGEETELGPETHLPGPVAQYFWTASPEDPSLEGQEEVLNPEVNPTVTTTYTLIETYVETGCVNTNSVVVTVVGGLPNAGTDQSICPGEEATLGPDTPIEGNVYTWTSSNPEEEFETDVPNPVVSPTVTTTYTLVEEYTEFGCINTATVVITVHPAPQAFTGPDLEICPGEEVTLGTEYFEPMPANTYLWTSEPEDDSISNTEISNPTVSPAVTTVYTLTETFVQTGCTTTNTVTVTVHERPLALVAEDTSVCGEQQVELGVGEADPELTYSWTSIPAGFTSDEANPTVTPGFMPVDENNQITFILEVSNEYCSDIAQVVVTVIPAPVLDISDDLVFCSAADAQNTPIGGEPVHGYTYLWESNQDDGFTSTEANPVVSPEVTTLYTVVVTDTLNGCSSTGYVLISISDLRFTRTGNPQVCEGAESVSLGTHIRIEGGMPPYQYFWSDAGGNTISNELNPTITVPFASSYNLLVLDQMNCPINLTVQVQYIESPFVELYIANEPAGTAHSVFIGQTVIFEARPEGYDIYEFYILREEPAEDINDEAAAFKSFFADIAPVQSGPSNVFTTNELITGDKVFVIAYDGACPGQSEMVTIFVNDLPNAFTPDGDGINDIFGQGADLTIFNRWGQRVYRGTTGWDGTFNGRKVSPGTYYYLLDIYDQNNRKTTIKGSVTVILQNQ